MIKQEKYLETTVGKKVFIEFSLPYKLNIVKDSKGKDKIIKSCSCVSITKTDTVLTIVYKAAKIPKHFTNQGYYFTTKTVTIYNQRNNRVEELIYKLTVKVKA